MFLLAFVIKNSQKHQVTKHQHTQPNQPNLSFKDLQQKHVGFDQTADLLRRLPRIPGALRPSQHVLQYAVRFPNDLESVETVVLVGS